MKRQQKNKVTSVILFHHNNKILTLNKINKQKLIK